MARQTKKQKSSGGRGSKEAIEKRRAARRLNAVLTGGAKSGDKLDGRTEKRRQRLIKELKEGRGGEPLKPIDYVTHVNELMDLGESVASLKKQGVKQRRTEQTPEVMEVVRKTQEAYDFRPEAWRMLGMNVEPASKTGAKGKRGARKRKTKTKTKSKTKSKAPSRRKTAGRRR